MTNPEHDQGAGERRRRPQQQRLQPHQAVDLDPAAPVWDRQVTNRQFGVNGQILAEVYADRKPFYITDVSPDPRFERPYIIMDDSVEPPRPDFPGHGFAYVNTDPYTTTVGRDYYGDRFQYPGTVSRQQFRVALYDARPGFSGTPVVTNLEPTNDTTLVWHRIAHPQPHRRPPEMVADYTVVMQLGLMGNPNYRQPDENAPYGYYLDHPVLGRDSTVIEDGVYVGGNVLEAILVDGESETLRAIHEELRSKLSALPERTLKRLGIRYVLDEVNHLVQQRMTYDNDRTEEISAQYPEGTLIPLSAFVEAGVGVCRQQGLVAAWLLEQLSADGLIEGTAGIERNTVPDGTDSHAWGKFIHEGTLYVIDPAQDFVGTKEEAERQGRHDYSLPTNVSYIGSPN